MKPLVLSVFWVSLIFSGRAVLRLLADWRRMRVAVRFVREAYGRLGELSSEMALARNARTPVFLTSSRPTGAARRSAPRRWRT